MSDEHDIHVTSYNQQGGITAYQVNIQQGNRVLDSRNAARLDQLLSEQTFKAIRVTAVMGDQEALQLAEQIKRHLDSKGLNVVGVDQALYTKSIKGVIIEKANADGQLQIIVGRR